MKEKIRRAFQANAFRYGTLSLVMSIIVIVILLGVNVMVGMLPTGMRQLDISEQKLFSVGPETEEIVSDVTKDVVIYCIAPADATDDGLIQMADRYADMSKHITTEIIVPELKPGFVKDHELSNRLSGGTDILVESGSVSKFINAKDIYEESFATQEDAYMYQMTHDSRYITTKFDAEGEITSAIKYVTTDNLPHMYVLKGHEELAVDAEIMALLDKKNVQLVEWNLLTEKTIPEDCDVILLHLPSKDLAEDEVDLLEAYIAAGGNVMIFANNQVDMEKNMPNFLALLRYYGVGVTNMAVILEDSTHYYQKPYNLLHGLAGDTALTENLSGKYVFNSYTSAIIRDENRRKTLNIETILASSAKSWLRRDLSSEILDQKIEGDLDGPFDYAVAITDSTNQGQGHVILFNSYAFTQLTGVNKLVPGNANGDVFMSCVNRLVKTESGVVIPAKTTKATTNTITAQEFNISMVLFVIVVPVIVLAVGISVWIIRRRR